MGEEKKRRKQKVNVFNIMFFVVVPIVIVSFLLIKSIYIHDAINAIDYRDLETYLKETNSIELGIAILGVTVSVWLGINISNMIDKRIIDELKSDVEEEEKRIENFSDEILKKQNELQVVMHNMLDMVNKKTNFLAEIYKTQHLYELSKYFYEVLKTDNNENINFGELHEIENLFFLCSDAYEKNIWGTSFEYACRLADLLQ